MSGQTELSPEMKLWEVSLACVRSNRNGKEQYLTLSPYYCLAISAFAAIEKVNTWLPVDINIADMSSCKAEEYDLKIPKAFMSHEIITVDKFTMEIGALNAGKTEALESTRIDPNHELLDFIASHYPTKDKIQIWYYLLNNRPVYVNGFVYQRRNNGPNLKLTT